MSEEEFLAAILAKLIEREKKRAEADRISAGKLLEEARCVASMTAEAFRAVDERDRAALAGRRGNPVYRLRKSFRSC